MAVKRNVITRHDIIKANTAMIQGKSIDFSKMPCGVVNIIRKNKPSASDIRKAFSDARRAVETSTEE
jgi:hypothetical protein